MKNIINIIKVINNYVFKITLGNVIYYSLIRVCIKNVKMSNFVDFFVIRIFIFFITFCFLIFLSYEYFLNFFLMK